MTDDRFEDVLREVAREYREPPPTPREEIWARIQARRKAAAEVPRTVRLSPRRPTWRVGAGVLGVAAVLLIGIGLGRLSGGPATPSGPIGPGTSPAAATSVADELATVHHLSRIDAFLVDFETGPADAEIRSTARRLLADTRLWLDAGRVADPRLRRLMEDLELMLVQIAEMSPTRGHPDRGLVEDGLSERQIRPRLRNAVPVGPAA